VNLIRIFPNAPYKPNWSILAEKLQVAQSQKKIHIGLNLKKKKLPNHDSEHYPPKEKMLRIVILHPFFGDFCQSEKKNLRLSHL
jgi:hypothetical protein